MRILLRERLVAGDTDEEVKQFLVERYGTFVLLKPPFDWSTLLLWLTPLIVLVGAGAVLFRYAADWARTAPAQVATSKLSPEEEEKLRALLAESEDLTAQGRAGVRYWSPSNGGTNTPPQAAGNYPRCSMGV